MPLPCQPSGRRLRARVVLRRGLLDRRRAQLLGERKPSCPASAPLKTGEQVRLVQDPCGTGAQFGVVTDSFEIGGGSLFEELGKEISATKIEERLEVGSFMAGDRPA